MAFFTVQHRSTQSKARLGVITTDHGVVHTPAFVPVGTKGTIKGLTQEQIADLHVQISFVNTYHLVTHPGADILRSAGGIHKLANYHIPLMSDSGGFQVFSLAARDRARNRNVVSPVDPHLVAPHDIRSQRKADVRGEEEPLIVKISEDGVQFRSVYDGQLLEFTPETSMDFQVAIGADINMAFDECTYYPATHDYTKKAMRRTHRWLERCIHHVACQKSESSKVENQTKNLRTLEPLNLQTKNQYLYGIIQGGTYEDLRKQSAEFVLSQNTPGVAIGGVSVGEKKEEMRAQVEWVAPYLPHDRPVHLLGVGQVDDIIDLVKHGIDTFDCVEPTRVARMGTVYRLATVLSQVEGDYKPHEYDIHKTIYKADLSPLDETCSCSVCTSYSKAYLHHLFKQRELLGYTLLSYHNLFVMERLMERIQELIGQDRV